jgi:hypothetical protein
VTAGRSFLVGVSRTTSLARSAIGPIRGHSRSRALLASQWVRTYDGQDWIFI